MKKLVLVLVPILAVAAGAVAAMGTPLTAHEDERDFRARLEGFQETPAVSTAANGRDR